MISYPLYLLHWPLISFIRIYNADSTVASRVLRILAVAFAVVGAVVTYRFVERPIRRLPAQGVAGPLCAGLVLASLTGFAIALSAGFPGRLAVSGNPMSWAEDERRSASCMVRFGQHATVGDYNLCVVTDQYSQPDVVVIGDSHANAFWPGIRQYYAPKVVAMIGGSSCPFLRNVRSWTDGTLDARDYCPQLIDAGFRMLSGRPRIVVLASRLAYYMSRSGFGVDESGLNSQSMHLDSSDFPGLNVNEFFPGALERDLRFLLDGGNTVILALQVPELGFNPSHCVDMRPIDRLLPHPTRDCKVPRLAVEQRQSRYRAIVKDVVLKLSNPKLTVP
jgi:hypothetical protein